MKETRKQREFREHEEGLDRRITELESERGSLVEIWLSETIGKPYAVSDPLDGFYLGEQRAIAIPKMRILRISPPDAVGYDNEVLYVERAKARYGSVLFHISSSDSEIREANLYNSIGAIEPSYPIGLLWKPNAFIGSFPRKCKDRNGREFLDETIIYCKIPQRIYLEALSKIKEQRIAANKRNRLEN